MSLNNVQSSILSFICAELESYFWENRFDIQNLEEDGNYDLVLSRIIRGLQEAHKKHPRDTNKFYIENFYQTSLKYLRQSRNRAATVVKSLQECYQQHLQYENQSQNTLQGLGDTSVESESLANIPCLSTASYAEIDKCFRKGLESQDDLAACEVALNQLRVLHDDLIYKVLPHRRLADVSISTKQKAFNHVFTRLHKLHTLFVHHRAAYHQVNTWLPHSRQLCLSLIQHCLVISAFPKCGTIKKKTGGAAGTKVPVTLSSLLPMTKLGLTENQLSSSIRVRYLDERSFAEWRNRRLDLASLPEVKTKWKCSKSNFLDTPEFVAQDLKLEDKAANGGVGGQTVAGNQNERVTDRKGIFVFYCDVTPTRLTWLTPGTTEIRMSVESDTVVPIVHTNQECEAEGTLFIDSVTVAAKQLCPRLDLTLDPRTELDVNVVVEGLSRYLAVFTGRGLFHSCQREYFTKRLLSECGGHHPHHIIMSCLNGATANSSHCETEPLSPSSSTSSGTTRDSLWKWFWNCTQLLRESKNRNLLFLGRMWVDGLILGFISKEVAEKMCKDNDRGSFVIRFMESKLRRISVQVGKQAWRPYTEEELGKSSLAQYLEGYPQMLTHFAHMPMEQGLCATLLPRYFPPPESLDSGYVERGEVSTELNELLHMSTEEAHASNEYSTLYSDIQEDMSDLSGICLYDDVNSDIDVSELEMLNDDQFMDTLSNFS